MLRMSCSPLMAWMTDPAPRNNRALKKAWVKTWNSARRERADAEGEEHVSQLRDGGVGQHALDVVLHQGDGGGKQRGECADDRHGLHRAGSKHEQRIRARHHVHAGGDHGRGVDQGGNRRGAFHGVGQPDVERKLRRLAACADEQQQRGRGDDGIADGEVSAARHGA